MPAKDYILKSPAIAQLPTEKQMVWAFDLGKASIGEAVRIGTEFKHRESLLIPAELARRGPAQLSGTPANRYRAFKTREAHNARERWLEQVWIAAGMKPLQAREVWENTVTAKWALKQAADYRLEREFAPAEFRRDNKTGEKKKVSYLTGKASDGAPASKPDDFQICYTSSLLRIRLLRGDKNLAEWQVYKSLRASLQHRGYGRVPWAAKEARQKGKTAKEIEEEEEKKLQQADERYREAVGKWPEFKRSVDAPFHFPCYFDAAKMGLWSQRKPAELRPCASHLADSTRNVRFDRADVRAELVMLGNQAAALLPSIQRAFARWQREGWKLRHPVTGVEVTYPVRAKSFGEFLCDGPAGQPDETSFEAFLNQRRSGGVRPGSFEEWMAALGQKTAKFDNRILNDCVLIPRYHVCKVDLKLATDADNKFNGQITPESLLATEVTLLLKLKNLLVSDPDKGQRKLTVAEVREIYRYAHRQLAALPLVNPDGETIKDWPGKVVACFAISDSEWTKIAQETEFLRRISSFAVSSETGDRKLSEQEAAMLLLAVGHPKKSPDEVTLGKLKFLLPGAKKEWKHAKLASNETLLRPMPGHAEVKAPRKSGRSAYSRVALRILKKLILSGEAPSEFHARLLARESDLLQKLGPAPGKPLVLCDDSKAKDEQQRRREDTENRQRGMLISELRFLLQMRKENETDSWENIFVPSQTLDALQQRHTEDGKTDADAAITDLLGTVNDPIVRHRLGVFSGRLKKLQQGDAKENLPSFGIPDAIVLEFVRENFMGEDAKRELKDFQNKREAARKFAREETRKAGSEEKSAPLKYELCTAQGCVCLYCGQPFSLAKLDKYDIDHIVPRGRGPDAMVNYVLAHHECNEAKDNQTPFQWWHHNTSKRAPSISWDGYKELVEKHATILRNKKVQLLLREDAAELVERYTALAETAWVSKLAQAIVNLRFGWTNGTDYSGPKPVKRVIVVSGGLTARVRRKYRLDKLLYTDTTDPEVLAKKVKNRDDKRHHALDAMVLTFIPQWARDPGKEGFFRFPAEFRDATGHEDYQGIRKLFGEALVSVMPRYLTFERAELAAFLYGRRDAGRVMVKRETLRDLAYKTVQMKKVFNLDYATVQAKAVRDQWVREELLRHLSTEPSAEEWNRFCDEFSQRCKDGSRGARILKVLLNRDEDPAEFKDLSKDECGGYRTKKQEHQGQFVYLDAKGSPRVRAVRVFESPAKVKAELEGMSNGVRTVGFFQSMCLVELKQPVTHGKITLHPGTYQLNTIKKDGRAQLTSALGAKSPEIGLAKLLSAGFTRKR